MVRPTTSPVRLRPDPARYVEVAQPFVDAGFDRLVMQNAGPHPDASWTSTGGSWTSGSATWRRDARPPDQRSRPCPAPHAPPASKAFFEHQFPAPHFDSVESVIDYRVPPEQATALARFDGSVVVERTAGEVSARCHDEQANFLALNLVHDIVTGAKGVEEARDYYAREFLDFRRQPTPYMEGLRFQPGTDTADPDQRVLSDQDLEQAMKEGEQQDQASG